MFHSLNFHENWYSDRDIELCLCTKFEPRLISEKEVMGVRCLNVVVYEK